MITPRDFWNKRSELYDQQVGTLYQKAYEDTAALTLKYLKPQDRVLEFACGTGIVTADLAPHVAQIRAIDISDEMVRRAGEKFGALGLTNIELSQTDLFDPCLEEGSFDAVVACNVLLYVDNFPQVMARIHALLRPGGYFLSATDCLGGSLSSAAIKKFWKSRTGTMPYVAFFSPKALPKKIAAGGFEVLETGILFPAPPNLFVAARKK